jgi:2-polyprenyl-3-methyl-5-hydroxy-6-metoxy-1,4-benzoquinol methylase
VSVNHEQWRYEAERRQGELIAAGREDAWGWTGVAGQIRADRRAAFLTRQARLGPGVVCLELGAGTGEFTTRLARSGCRLVAVELSEATAAICQTRAGSQVEVIVGNVETGEGLDRLGGVDAIVGVSVLHHLNLDLCFENAFGHLKPGGRFAFSEPNMANPQIWLERHFALVKKWRHVTAHETAFRPDELRQLFERAGLVVEVSEPFEFLHPSTPPRLVKSVLAVEALLERSHVRAIAGSVRVAGCRPSDPSDRDERREEEAPPPPAFTVPLPDDTYASIE